MGDILNNLTPLELIRIRDKALAKRDERSCLLCGNVAPMRKGQRFCCEACRTLFNNQVRLLNQNREREAWAAEREDFVREIADLRRQLAERS